MTESARKPRIACDEHAARTKLLSCETAWKSVSIEEQSEVAQVHTAADALLSPRSVRYQGAPLPTLV